MSYNQSSEWTTSLDTNPTIAEKNELQSFLSEVLSNDKNRYASFSFPIESIDPLALLEICWDKSTFQYYWEKPSEEFAIAAGGSVATLTASGPDRFEKINSQSESIRNITTQYSEIAHPGSGIFLLGGFSFFDQISADKWDSFSPGHFTLPEWLILKDGKFSVITFTVDLHDFGTADEIQEYLNDRLTQLDHILDHEQSEKDVENNPSSKKVRMSLPPNQSAHKDWITSVTNAKELIKEGAFKKIVLARSLSVPKSKEVSPTKVLNTLREQYFNCYNFLLHQPGGQTFLGSTPERLVSARKKLLLTEALAGSIKRGQTATEDSILEKQLSGNAKDREEHNFVIKDIEERLQPFTKNIERSSKPEIKKLSNVQHLYTPIRAQLDEQSNIFEVLNRMHPTPAVGGYPWHQAASYIKELEQFERGMYAGPIGWINGKGHLEFAVGIRSALFSEDQIDLFAGCGIVRDSDPQSEWEETNLKLKPLLSALQYD